MSRIFEGEICGVAWKKTQRLRGLRTRRNQQDLKDVTEVTKSGEKGKKTMINKKKVW